jgi:ribonuclease III
MTTQSISYPNEVPVTANSLADLSRQIGYRFLNEALLTQALTHRSSHTQRHNERLEFLGDSVLSAIISTALFYRYPDATEGELSQARASLVCEETLAKIAKNFQLERYLYLGSGELKSGGGKRPALLADALEAVIGAIYLDAGLKTCKTCILNWYQIYLDTLPQNPHYKDPKSLLQEYLQAQKRPLPHYKCLKQAGAPHAPVFQITCQLLDVPSTHPLNKVVGVGTSRRKAEQAAANKLLDLLKKEALK